VITLSSGSEPVITGAGGQPLTAAEEQVLQQIWSYYEQSFDVLQRFLDPIG
jgi:hypothetical protein